MTQIEKAIKQIKEREAAEKAALDAEIQRIAAKQQVWKDAQERERKKASDAEAAERKEAAEREFETRMRHLFFGGNPIATEQDYQAARAQLRQQILLEDAQS